MKFLTKLIFILFLSISVFPQGEKKSDIETRLRNYPDKKMDNLGYAKLLLEYSENIQFSLTEKAIDTIQKALNIFKNFNNNETDVNIAECYNRLGDCYYSIEYYYLAMDSYTNAYKYFVKEHGESTSYVLVNLGNCFFAQKIYDVANDYYKKALEMFLKDKNDHGIALIYNNYGLIELRLNNPESALKYFNQALQIREKMGEDYLVGHSYSYITQSYIQKKEFKTAEAYAYKALNILENSNKMKGFVYLVMAEVYSRLADIKIELNELSTALESINKAAQIYKDANNDINTIKIEMKTGKIYLLMKDYEKANIHISNGLLKALARNAFNELKEGYLLLTRISIEKGNTFQAIENLENFNNSVDTLLNSSILKKLSEINTIIETNRIEKENSVLSEKNKANQYLLTSFGTLFTVLLLFFLYRLQNEKKNEIRLKQLSDATFECIIIHHKGKIENVNDRFEKMFGLTSKEVIGRNVDEFIHLPGDDFENDNSLSYESKIVIKGGKEIDIEVLSKPYQYKNKDFHVVAFRDISERKKIEEKLKKSEELYKKIVMTVPYILTIHDITGRIEFANELGLKYLGYDFEADKISERNLLDFIADEDKPKAMENYQIMFEKHLGPVEYLLIHKSGRKELFEVQGEILCTPEGTPYGTIFILKSIEERKRAELKLKISENRFRQLAEAGYEALFIHKNGVIYDLNNAACRLFGYERSELIGTHIADLFTSDSKEVILDRIRTYETASYEAECVSKNEIKIPCELNSRYIHFDDELVRLTAIRDISERKKAEKELSEMKELLEASYEQTAVPLMLVGHPDNKIRLINSAAIEYFGIEPPYAIVDKKWSDVNWQWKSYDSAGNIIPPEELPSRLAEIGIKSLRKELRIVRRDGIEKWGLVFSVPIYNKIGEQIAAYSSLIDITERKKTEEALRFSEEKYRFMAENMVDVIWQLDKNFNFIYISPTDEKMRGFKSSEVIGKSLWENVTPQTKEYILALNAIKEENEKKGIRMEAKPYMVEEICKDGSTIWCEVSVSPVFDAIGNANGFIGVTRNISERKRIQEELISAKEKAEQANKTKSEFLANMSHEIRTPMNAILGFTELIKNKYDDEVLQEYLAGIETGGRNLLHLINDILDLSKIEAGKIVIKNEQTNIYTVCQEIEQIFSYQIKTKDIKFGIQIAESFPKIVVIDEIRLRQILLNLVGNAIKFTNYGEVNLKVSFKPSLGSDKIDVIFEVEDTGIGIEDSQLAKIFEAFYQQEGQNSRRYGGTGLGLAITRRLVEVMGGRINVISEVDKGSSFKVCFNNLEVIEEKVEEPLPVNQNITFNNAVVLIVRDQNSGRSLIKDYLNNSEVRIVDCEIGKNAIELAKLSKPELVIVEAEKSNEIISLLKEIKSTNVTFSVPVVVVLEAALSTNELIIQNSTGRLIKPVNKRQLIQELMKHLKSKVNNSQLNELENSQPNYIEEDILNLLYSEYLKKSEEIANDMILDEISLFASELKVFALDNNIPVIVKYATELEDSMSSYNYERITKSLRDFKLRLDELQKINL